MKSQNKNIKKFRREVQKTSQPKALAAALEQFKVVSKSTARRVGISDPNRIVNRLRDRGMDIKTTTFRNTDILEGETYYTIA